MSTHNTKTKIEKPAARATVSIATDSHQRAQLASTFEGESLVEYLSKAADVRSLPILKKHGVKLPSDSKVSLSQAA